MHLSRVVPTFLPRYPEVARKDLIAISYYLFPKSHYVLYLHQLTTKFIRDLLFLKCLSQGSLCPFSLLLLLSRMLDACGRISPGLLHVSSKKHLNFPKLQFGNLGKRISDCKVPSGGYLSLIELAVLRTTYDSGAYMIY